MGILEVRNLSYQYPDGPQALRGVDLQVDDGECLAMIGPNGAGKSTLMLAVLGFVEAKGRVVVDGLELSRRTVKEIRRRAGIVFQEADDQLFMPTVFDDVAFGPLCLGLRGQEVRQRVSEALRLVDAENLVQRAPYHLSAGEKRRVALATVLAMRPRMIFFDEPSSGLDPRSRRMLIQTLRSLPATRIVATHDLDLARAACSRVVLMAEGRMVATGPTQSILLDDALMGRLL